MPRLNTNYPDISFLPVLLQAASSALSSSEDQLNNFHRAVKKPYSLDEKTIKGVIKSYSKQNQSIAEQQELCLYWRNCEPTLPEIEMLMELEENLEQMLEINQQILTLARECKKSTIESLLGQDDAELGLNYLRERLFGSSHDLEDENNADEDEFYDEEDGQDDNLESSEQTLEKLNEVMTDALFELKALTELDGSNKQALFDNVKLFLTGVMSTAIDLVELEQPGLATALYAEIEAAAKIGGLRAIVDFQNTHSERTYSVSQIADNDMETAMNYIGQELGTTLAKSVNELPMSLRQPETYLRGIEALLGNVLNQRFNSPHDILESFCEHVHMALDSLKRSVH